MDADLKAMFSLILDEQLRGAKALTELTATLNRSADLEERRIARAEAMDARLEESQIRLDATLERFIASSAARMMVIEANLDGLIQAITKEHSNGKKAT